MIQLRFKGAEYSGIMSCARRRRPAKGGSGGPPVGPARRSATSCGGRLGVSPCPSQPAGLRVSLPESACWQPLARRRVPQSRCSRRRQAVSVPTARVTRIMHQPFHVLWDSIIMIPST